MSQSLVDRLQKVKAELLRSNGEIARGGGKLPKEVGDAFQESLASDDEIEHWIDLIHTREAARQMLAGLEAKADPRDDHVPFGDSRIKFQHARLIGVQAYLATNWAIADRMTGMAGRVLCIKTSLDNPQHPPQLLSHFVGEETKNRAAAMLFSSVRRTFGWPVGLSYALRNHFVHDGGQLPRATFFEGPDSKSGFRISDDGWRHVERRAQTYGVDSGHHRAGAAWPTTPKDDLRILLDACERETDDALGVLVGSAVRSLVSHIGCLLGVD
jgi:hypothetical protein